MMDTECNRQITTDEAKLSINSLSVINDFDLISLPAHHQVFSQGESCLNYVVVTSGSIKVFARSSEGKEVVLYRIKPGEVCVLTISCLLGNSRYPAEAVTETAVTARIIPHKEFDRLLEESVDMRKLVFNSFAQRLNDLMLQIEQVVLESVDQRLNRFLLSHVNESGMISATHQEIAIEIGSAREVVSRHLKMLENQQIIKLHRGKLALINTEALKLKFA